MDRDGLTEILKGYVPQYLFGTAALDQQKINVFHESKDCNLGQSFSGTLKTVIIVISLNLQWKRILSITTTTLKSFWFSEHQSAIRF